MHPIVLPLVQHIRHRQYNSSPNQVHPMRKDGIRTQIDEPQAHHQLQPHSRELYHQSHTVRQRTDVIHKRHSRHQTPANKHPIAGQKKGCRPQPTSVNISISNKKSHLQHIRIRDHMTPVFRQQRHHILARRLLL